MSGCGVVALVEQMDAKKRWRIGSPYDWSSAHGHALTTMWSESPAHLPYPSDLGAVVLPGVSATPGHEREFSAFIDGIHDRGAAVIYEMDDDIISYAWVEHMVASGQGGSEVRALQEVNLWSVQQCDAVTVSTEALARRVRAIVNRPVYVLENRIDVDWFRAGITHGPPVQPCTVTIGWAGGVRAWRDVEPMLAAWRVVADRYPSVRFLWSGWAPLSIYRYIAPERITIGSWADGNGYADGMRVDIGCCPAEPTPFNVCKSAIKAWEFALAGAAVVASPCVYGGTIEHGENGYLAETIINWADAISALIENGLKRAEMAARLANDVERYWSMASGWQAWPDTYVEIIGRYRAGALSANVPDPSLRVVR